MSDTNGTPGTRQVHPDPGLRTQVVEVGHPALAREAVMLQRATSARFVTCDVEMEDPIRHRSGRATAQHGLTTGIRAGPEANPGSMPTVAILVLTTLRKIFIVVMCCAAASCASARSLATPTTASPGSGSSVPGGMTTIAPCQTTPPMSADEVARIVVPPGQPSVLIHRGEVLEVVLAESESYLSAPAGQPLPPTGFPWQPLINSNPSVLTSTAFPGDCLGGAVASLPMALHAFRARQVGQAQLQAPLTQMCRASEKCRTLPALDLKVTIVAG